MAQDQNEFLRQNLEAATSKEDVRRILGWVDASPHLLLSEDTKTDLQRARDFLGTPKA